jgi:DNA-binding MarR family transcriptional regulator
MSTLMHPSSSKARPAVSDDVVELAAALRLAVVRLARRLRQRADTGATPSMLSALSTLEHLGPLTIGELAAAEQVTPPTVTSIVARLDEAGLVTREADSVDRRISRVSVSRDGRRLLERSRSRKTAYLARRLRALGSEERATVRDALLILERLAGDER